MNRSEAVAPQIKGTISSVFKGHPSESAAKTRRACARTKPRRETMPFERPLDGRARASGKIAWRQKYIPWPMAIPRARTDERLGMSRINRLGIPYQSQKNLACSAFSGVVDTKR